MLNFELIESKGNCTLVRGFYGVNSKAKKPIFETTQELERKKQVDLAEILEKAPL